MCIRDSGQTARPGGSTVLLAVNGLEHCGYQQACGQSKQRIGLGCHGFLLSVFRSRSGVPLHCRGCTEVGLRFDFSYSEGVPRVGEVLVSLEITRTTSIIAAKSSSLVIDAKDGAGLIE